MTKTKIYSFLDWAITVSLCFLIFCLPFAKAGVEISTWLVIFLWIIKRVIGYRAESAWGMFSSTSLNKTLGILLLVNLLSVVFSNHQALSWRAFFGKELKFILLFLVVVESLNSHRRIKGVLITVILSILLIIADSCVQHFTGVDFLRQNVLIRLRASFATANAFAAWLLIMIPFSIGLAAQAKNRILKVFLSILAFILVICLILSFSRGGWIAFLLGMPFMVIFVLKNVRFRIKLLSLIVLSCLFIGFHCMPSTTFLSIKSGVKSFCRFDFSCYGGGSLNDRLKSFANSDEISVVRRLSLWRKALHIVKERPIFGCGLNNYIAYVRNDQGHEDKMGYPHNCYLQRAAETGLPGLIVFLWVLFRFFRQGLRYIGQKKDYLVLGLLMGLLAFLFHAFFDNHFYSIQLAVLFWYMVGLTMAVMKLSDVS